MAHKVRRYFKQVKWTQTFLYWKDDKLYGIFILQNCIVYKTVQCTKQYSVQNCSVQNSAVYKTVQCTKLYSVQNCTWCKVMVIIGMEYISWKCQIGDLLCYMTWRYIWYKDHFIVILFIIKDKNIIMLCQEKLYLLPKFVFQTKILKGCGTFYLKSKATFLNSDGIFVLLVLKMLFIFRNMRIAQILIFLQMLFLKSPEPGTYTFHIFNQ